MAEETVKVMDYVTEELDKVIPQHQLLDNTAAKHKNELVHRGTLATRHRPSGEGLRTQILRRQQADSKEGSPVRKCKEQPVPPPLPSSSKCDSKNNSSESKPGKSFLADIQSALNTKSNAENDVVKEEEKPVEDERNNESPTHSDRSPEDPRRELSPIYSPSKGPRPSFLAGIENLGKKQGPGESGESIPVIALRKVKPKATPNPIVIGKSNVQDQLRMKLEARKKLVDETDEGAENET